MANLDPILKYITKPFGSMPGWSLLLLASYWFANTGQPQKLAKERFGLGEVEISETALVLILTLVFYLIGDWLDEIVYKKRVTVPAAESSSGKEEYIPCPRFDPGWVNRERSAAREALGIQDGSYRVAMALLDAAGKSNGVKFANESGKFFRSLVVPFLLSGIFGLCVTSIEGRGWLLGSALVALAIYILLKQFHIWLLYRRAKGMTSDKKFRSETLGEFILFFWDARLLGSADPKGKDLCRLNES
jgi:hypothetical protein